MKKTYGAGKTTAVRILTTLIRPDAGRAEVAGFDVTAVVGAPRSLFGTTQGVPKPSVWSLQHPVATTLGMSVILLGRDGAARGAPVQPGEPLSSTPPARKRG